MTKALYSIAPRIIPHFILNVYRNREEKKEEREREIEKRERGEKK